MLQFRHDRPGPGINPDAPKKTGIAWYFDILYREFWPMVHLNILFVLSCIPIITIGASYTAMHTLLLRMLRDKPVDVWPDFRLALKENFKVGTKVFLVQVLVLVIYVINYEFYGVMNIYIQAALTGVGVLLFLVNLYIVPVLVSVELPLKHVFKNSFFLVFLNLKWTIPAGILAFSTHFFNLYFYYLSIYPSFVIGNVLLAYTLFFVLYIGIEKYCYNGTEEQ